MTGLAVVAALAAMVSNSGASLLESAGSRRAESAGRSVTRQPRYLVGLGLDGLGWLLSVVALRFLPVFAVQSILAGSIAVTTLAAAGGSPRRLSRRARVAVPGVVLGLALVALCAAPGRPARLPSAATPVLFVWTAVLVLAFVPARRSGRPLVQALVAGLAYGGVSLSVRALHVRSSLWASARDLLGEPLAWGLVVLGVIGTVLLATAMGQGAVGTVVAVLSVTQVVVPGLVGLLVLGDRIRPGWAPVLVVGWVLTVAGVALLARGRPASRPSRS